MKQIDRFVHKPGLTGIAIAMLLALASLALAFPASASATSFQDGVDDAYRIPGQTGSPASNQLPNPALSDPEADILDVDLTHVKTPPGVGRSYSVSMTIKGTPEPEHNYIVAGAFGRDCYLYHLLTPGTRSIANAFCGAGEGRMFFAGYIRGTRVIEKGQSVSATYTFRPKRLPLELKNDRVLKRLFAFTCLRADDDLGCTSEQVLDMASHPKGSFRI